MPLLVPAWDMGANRAPSHTWARLAVKPPYAWIVYLLLLWSLAGCVTPTPYFRITFIDTDTGRGIPLVELETQDKIRYVSDSAGVVAVDPQELMRNSVYFNVRSHGYKMRQHKYGSGGVQVELAPGGERVVALQRVNIAERLYRVTGEGIYRDSQLLGDPTPLSQFGLPRGGVFGQDSVVNAVYAGKLYWFWGDTLRGDSPQCNFKVAGAFSTLPEHNGLDPAVGVDLEYYVASDGFTRPMCEVEGPGAVWISGLMVTPKQDGEHLLAYYMHMQDLETMLEQGVAIWNPQTQQFEKHTEFPLDTPLHPIGHPFELAQAGQRWFYFGASFPTTRVRAKLQDIVDPASYQGYTCLRRGSRWNDENPPLDRDNEGHLVWAWKSNTPGINAAQWQNLVQRKLVTRAEGRINLLDIKTGEPVVAHNGSTTWNAYKNRWILITVQQGGHSPLGEVWYAEARNPLGPWSPAQKILTHDNYSFYNVKQHPYFASGPYVYFEGTYTISFSGSDNPTPRYDYNQIMYRLDLNDPRLPSVP